MKIPRLTAEHGIGRAHGTYAALAAAGAVESGFSVRMMVGGGSVSRDLKAQIEAGDQRNPCDQYPGTKICWGGHNHRTNYVCCPQDDVCLRDERDYPYCRLEREALTNKVLDKGLGIGPGQDMKDLKGEIAQYL